MIRVGATQNQIDACQRIPNLPLKNIAYQAFHIGFGVHREEQVSNDLYFIWGGVAIEIAHAAAVNSL